MKKTILNSKIPIIIVWVLSLSGIGIITYSISLQSTPIMIIGFSLIGVAILLAFPMSIREINKSKEKLKNDFDDIIDLIKERKLKDAWNKTEKDIYSPTLNPYLQGLILGTQFKGEAEDLDQLKFKNKKK